MLEIDMTQNSETIADQSYRYHVKAFAPDPRGGDNYFVYDSTVDRSAPINSGEQYELLMQGLSDHVFKETGVRCPPDSFALQLVQEISRAKSGQRV
jgi:hypothetical protein